MNMRFEDSGTTDNAVNKISDKITSSKNHRNGIHTHCMALSNPHINIFFINSHQAGVRCSTRATATKLDSINVSLSV